MLENYCKHIVTQVNENKQIMQLRMKEQSHENLRQSQEGHVNGLLYKFSKCFKNSSCWPSQVLRLSFDPQS